MSEGFKRNDIIICISNLKNNVSLTIGKEYRCLSYANCTKSVMIVDDDGIKKNYGSHNFKKK